MPGIFNRFRLVASLLITVSAVAPLSRLDGQQVQVQDRAQLLRNSPPSSNDPYSEENGVDNGQAAASDNDAMLNGSREAVLRKVQPISIHGQLSYDVHYTFADEPDAPRVARIGPEAMDGALQAGDRAMLDFMIGVVTAVRRL